MQFSHPLLFYSRLLPCSLNVAPSSFTCSLLSAFTFPLLAPHICVTASSTFKPHLQFPQPLPLNSRLLPCSLQVAPSSPVRCLPCGAPRATCSPSSPSPSSSSSPSHLWATCWCSASSRHISQASSPPASQRGGRTSWSSECCSKCGYAGKGSGRSQQLLLKTKRGWQRAGRT